MVKSAFSIAAVAAVAGIASIALVPGIASAATAGPAVLARSFGPAATGPTDGTILTFTVSTGLLAITAPDGPMGLTGTGVPGSVMSGNLGSAAAVTVTDNRASIDSSWTVTAGVSDWVSTTTPTETIPAAVTTYDPGTITQSSGDNTLTVASTAPIALSLDSGLATTDTAVVLATGGHGNNVASWDPTIAVTIPVDAITDDYSGTLYQSVF